MNLNDINADNDFASLRRAFSQRVRLSTDDWEMLRHHCGYLRLTRGAHFIHRGEVAKYVAFVTHGMLRFYYATTEGKTFNKEFVSEGDFVLSLSSHVTGEPVKYSIEALEDCRLITLRYDRLKFLAETSPDWQALLLRWTEQAFIKKDEKEAYFLLNTPRQRYQRFCIDFPQLEQRLTDYHIAAYLGITPVSLSRIKRSLIEARRAEARLSRESLAVASA